MENIPSNVSVHVSYCVPCGGKAAFDELAYAILKEVPSAKVTGEKDHRSGAFEVSINGQLVHSRAQTLAYPDVNNTVEVIKKVSCGNPVPSSLLQKPITDCIVS